MPVKMTDTLRKWRWWWFHVKLNIVAMFIEKHRLYPVELNKELLEVWKRREKWGAKDGSIFTNSFHYAVCKCIKRCL